jgi:hypothetical protein
LFADFFDEPFTVDRFPAFYRNDAFVYFRPKRIEPNPPFLLPFLQQLQRLTYHLAGGAVAS